MNIHFASNTFCAIVGRKKKCCRVFNVSAGIFGWDGFLSHIMVSVYLYKCTFSRYKGLLTLKVKGIFKKKKKRKEKILGKFKPQQNRRVFWQHHYFIIFDYYFITGIKERAKIRRTIIHFPRHTDPFNVLSSEGEA